jgi:hypothetical protein
MLRHMELVEYDLLCRILQMCLHRRDERIPPVHRYRTDALYLLLRQLSPELAQTALLALLGYIRHPGCAPDC